MATQEIDALVDGGEASAGPPLGPALGPLGVPVGKVVQEINQATQDFKGMKVPVVVRVDTDTRDFEIEVGTPPASALLFAQANVDKGSGTPNLEKAGDVSFEGLIKVARGKKADLLGADLKARCKEVLGTANSCGLTCEGKDPRVVQKEIDRGVWDAKFQDA